MPMFVKSNPSVSKSRLYRFIESLVVAIHDVFPELLQLGLEEQRSPRPKCDVYRCIACVADKFAGISWF